MQTNAFFGFLCLCSDFLNVGTMSDVDVIDLISSSSEEEKETETTRQTSKVKVLKDKDGTPLLLPSMEALLSQLPVGNFKEVKKERTPSQSVEQPRKHDKKVCSLCSCVTSVV